MSDSRPAQPSDASDAVPADQVFTRWLVRIGIRRIIAGLLVCVLLAVGLAWISSIVLANQRMDAYLQEQLAYAQTDALLSSTNLNQRLTLARSAVQTLALDQNIVATLGRFGPQVERSTVPQPERGARWMADPQLRVTSEILNRVVLHFGFNTLWLTNAAGDTVAEGHAEGLAPFVGTNYADREYFKAAQQGQQGRQFAIGRVTNVYGLFLSTPVQISGQFVGMVGVGVSVPKLGDAIEGIRAVVTDDLGVIVLTQDPALMMKTTPESTVHNLSEEARTTRYKRTEFAASGLMPLQVDDSHGLFHLRQFSQSYLMASHATDDGSLRVYALRDLGEPMRNYQRDQLTWFGLVSLLIILVALLLAGFAQHLLTTERQRSQLLLLNGALAREAQTDALTGCANRRHFLASLEQEGERGRRYGLATSLLSLDIDHFKRVNDTWGHAAGDEVLKHFAAIVQAQLRQADVLGRLGGEEFSVLLPHASAADAAQVAERIRAAVEASPASFAGHAIPITVSLGGAAVTREDPVSSEQLLARADAALYEAKHAGRNRVNWSAPATRPA